MPIPVSVTAISRWVPARRVRDSGLAIGWRELDGVRQEVPDDLLQPARVGGQRADAEIEVAGQPDAFAVGRGTHRLDRRVDDRRRIHGADLEEQLSGIDAARVEQVLDELRLHARVALDRLQTPHDVRFVLAADAKHLAPAEDRVERRAQLVRERREELVLHFAQAFRRRARGALALEQGGPLGGGALRRLVEACVVDGDAGLRGNAGDEALGPLGEHAGLRVAEEQSTDDLARPGLDGHGEIAAYRQVPLSACRDAAPWSP